LTVKPTNLATRVIRLTRVALHIGRAVVIAAVIFPFLGRTGRHKCAQRWSARLLEVLAMRIDIVGTPPANVTLAMIVANHVSWIDIFAINAVHPARFVAKSEIRHWPVVGWIAQLGGTLFVERHRRHNVAQVNENVVAALRQGDVFAVFPEGMITHGDVLLPFHASLLQPALECGASLYPVAIRYTRADGSLCSEADYEGEKTIAGSMLLMVTQPVINVRLQFLAPLSCAGKHRRELADAAAQLIADALGLPAPRRRAGPTDDPKA
jgi:1-acyl-sn-glycerol-3-phosphate acyltransferase